MGARGRKGREREITGLRGAGGGEARLTTQENSARGGGGGESDQRDALTKAHFNDKFEVKSYNQKAQASMRKLFGREITAQELGRMVGAWDGLKLTVKANRDGTVTVEGKHKYLQTQDGFIRSFAKDAKGKVFVNNESLFFKQGSSRTAPAGFGSTVFAHQRDYLRASGKVDYIKNFALRNDNPERIAIGYRYWVDVGFNARLTSSLQTLWRNSNPLEQIRNIAPPQTVQELYGRTGGREFWRRRGESTTMIFDLRRGSDSNRIADEYFRGKGIITGVSTNGRRRGGRTATT